MKKTKSVSKVISTRLLSERELDNLMAALGTILISEGFSPEVHTQRLLSYRLVLKKKGGAYVGVMAPLGGLAAGGLVPVTRPGEKAATAVVQVSDLPVEFSVDGGRGRSIPVGLAFGIHCPSPVMNRMEEVLTPYTSNLEDLKSQAGSHLAGVTFDKKVPGVECDHCGTLQEVVVPTTVTRVEGDRGYGPGGSVQVVCSNPACGRPFPVTWDSVSIIVEFT